MRWLPAAALAALLVAAAPSFADEAMDRRDRSVTILEAEGIPVNKYLPVIETEAQSLRRSDEEVLQRLLALVVVAVRAETGDEALTQELIQRFGVADSFTPEERRFLETPAPGQQDVINFTWRYEAAHVLLWALQIYDQLGPAGEITDVSAMANVLNGLGPDGLRQRAALRDQAILLDEADLIYRYHWAVRNARLLGEPAPPSLDPSVVMERHYTFNWLIGYGRDWDEVPTDT